MPKDLAKDSLTQNMAAGRSLEEMWDWIRKEKTIAKPAHLRQRLLRALEIEDPKQNADAMVFTGCFLLFRDPFMVRNYFTLMRRLGISFTYPQEEMCCGLPPLEMARGKDRELAEQASREFTEANLELAKKAGAKNAVYLCVWCVHLAKKFSPDSPIGVMFYPDILLDKLAKERLRVEPKVIGYYEGCHRRNKQWAPGVTLQWDRYREVLNNVEGLKVVKMPDHLCCVDIPERILDAAHDLGVDSIVCSCHACAVRLRLASKDKMPIEYYPDFLLGALGKG